VQIHPHEEHQRLTPSVIGPNELLGCFVEEFLSGEIDFREHADRETWGWAPADDAGDDPFSQKLAQLSKDLFGSRRLGQPSGKRWAARCARSRGVAGRTESLSARAPGARPTQPASSVAGRRRRRTTGYSNSAACLTSVATAPSGTSALTACPDTSARPDTSVVTAVPATRVWYTAAKWDIDGPALATLVKGWTPGQRYAVVDAVRRWWNSDRSDTEYEPSLRVAGLIH
jgi:hypothetical protein